MGIGLVVWLRVNLTLNRNPGTRVRVKSTVTFTLARFGTGILRW